MLDSGSFTCDMNSWKQEMLDNVAFHYFHFLLLHWLTALTPPPTVNGAEHFQQSCEKFKMQKSGMTLNRILSEQMKVFIFFFIFHVFLSDPALATLLPICQEGQK